jgi:hypothetical protein
LFSKNMYAFMQESDPSLVLSTEWRVEMRLKALAFFLLTIMFLSGHSLGQSAQVTSGALFRTFMIETNFGRGTTFSIDVDNREYWLTAKHVFTGIKTGPAGVAAEEAPVIEPLLPAAQAAAYANMATAPVTPAPVTETKTQKFESLPACSPQKRCKQTFFLRLERETRVTINIG